MGDSRGISVGEDAPQFSAPLVRPDGSDDDVALEELLSDSAVLLCFYTNDFSPDCVSEWCEFRDFGWFSANDDVRVVGVSKSRVRTHHEFIKRLDLNFPLYSDTDLDIAAAYGVRYRAFRLFPRARRSCFLIDTDGVVRYKWISEHPLDPSRDTPPVAEIHRTVERELDV